MTAAWAIAITAVVSCLALTGILAIWWLDREQEEPRLDRDDEVDSDPFNPRPPPADERQPENTSGFVWPFI